MNISQLKERLMEELMLLFRAEDGLKRYVAGTEVYQNGKFVNRVNAFGIYENESGRFVGFITDAAKGEPMYMAEFSSENDACWWLYDFVYSYR